MRNLGLRNFNDYKLSIFAVMSLKYKKQLAALQIEALKPMQEKAIETILNHKETVLLSPTGSGKTLAFLLPLLSLINKNVDEIQILILLPTRELVLQVEQVFKSLHTGYKVNACYGGHSMTVEKNNFKEPPKVLIGTPGRILDHVNRKSFSAKAINVLIIDEFDKCLEMGFKEEMSKIIKRLRLSKTILTSATDLLDIPEFTGVTNPKKLDYLSTTTLEEKAKLQIKAIHSPEKDKLVSLSNLLKEIAFESTIVFCNRKDSIDRVAQFLYTEGFDTVSFHGDLEQDERDRAIIKFKNGTANILLSTDLASRGLDIDHIKNIVHYHLPHQADVFTHRNGRTARMQNEGTAFLIFAPDEKLSFDIDAQKSIDLYDFKDIKKYQTPLFETLYISKGKKDKINKIDIVGFFLKQLQLANEDLGMIVVKDFASYVAINRKRVKAVLIDTEKQKIKGKTFKIEIAR